MVMALDLGLKHCDFLPLIQNHGICFGLSGLVWDQLSWGPVAIRMCMSEIPMAVKKEIVALVKNPVKILLKDWMIGWLAPDSFPWIK